MCVYEGEGLVIALHESPMKWLDEEWFSSKKERQMQTYSLCYVFHTNVIV